MSTVDTESRELDLQIAEQVMGFQWFHCVAGTGVERNQFCSKEQEETWRGVGWKMTPITSPPPSSEFSDASGCPRYSTDIAAAMSVVEKMVEKGFGVSMARHPEDAEWWVVFDKDNDAIMEQCYIPSLPEAICKAALKASE